ncbi:MAG: ATP synthase F1 subunit epsilon [Deltaproteobacteria bacterium]|nr:ATP synthase F1 subunit epsilon [Deltaproteobacteria bacterium]
MSSERKAAGRLRLEVVSPRGVLVDEQVEEVVLSTQCGQMGVLSGHEPLLALLQPAPLSYRKPGGATGHLAVSDGFVEAGADHVLVLTQIAEKAEDIDVERAQVALRGRSAELAALPPGDPARPPLEQALRRAQVRLAAVELARKG